jgi:hypothetical protein
MASGVFLNYPYALTNKILKQGSHEAVIYVSNLLKNRDMLIQFLWQS